VRVKLDEQSEWRKGEIATVLSHRSYEVRLQEDDTVRRRTSKHVRFAAEEPIISRCRPATRRRTADAT